MTARPARARPTAPEPLSEHFAHVRHWVFDLDNTLYPARYRLFDQIDERMGEYIARLFGIGRAEARRIQKDYFYRYGTTLRGLMKEHGADPRAFLDYVHDIDYSHIAPDPALDAALAALPGRKWVFTNGTRAHAEAVMQQLGITGHIDEVFDIEDAGYLPKPFPETYAAFVRRTGISPARAAMFEDIARNLREPHAMGMRTVLVDHPDNEDACCINDRHGDREAEYVHFITDDLARFLAGLSRNLTGRTRQAAE
jgi:putative hydrolase of the HAD superfamily